MAHDRAQAEIEEMETARDLASDDGERQTNPYPPHGWTCFHCGETFGNPNLARAHFGGDPRQTPACVLIQERGILYELRDAQERATKAEARVEQLEYEAAGLETQIAQSFKGCRTINEAWRAYDFMAGRALSAEKLWEFLESRGVESVYFSDGTQINPATETLRGAVCRMSEAAGDSGTV